MQLHKTGCTIFSVSYIFAYILLIEIYYMGILMHILPPHMWILMLAKLHALSSFIRPWLYRGHILATACKQDIFIIIDHMTSGAL